MPQHILPHGGVTVTNKKQGSQGGHSPALTCPKSGPTAADALGKNIPTGALGDALATWRLTSKGAVVLLPSARMDTARPKGTETNLSQNGAHGLRGPDCHPEPSQAPAIIIRPPPSPPILAGQPEAVSSHPSDSSNTKLREGGEMGNE